MPTTTRRQFLGSGAATVATAAQRTRGSARRPNILYIHSHDTGRYTQPYGVEVPTPNLQRLAAESVLFRMAFSGAPTCSPSRAALVTGQCAHSSGMLGLAHRGFALNDYRQHILYTLRDAGYTSALAGIQHIAKSADLIGYDRVLPTKTTNVADVAPVAVEFIKSAPKQPFFLDVGFRETHREFHPPGPQEDERFRTRQRRFRIRPGRGTTWRVFRPARECWTRASAPCWAHSNRAGSRKIRWSSRPPTTAWLSRR